MEINLSNIELTGKLVNLRELSEQDFNALHSFASDAEFLKYQTWGPNTLEQTRSYFDAVIQERRLNPRLDFNLAIASKENGQFLGNISLAISRAGLENAEIGYNVLTSFSGKGFATNAAGIMMTFAFGALKLKQIEGFCHPENLASIKIMTRLGMTKQGVLKGHRLERGAARDSVKFILNNPVID